MFTSYQLQPLKMKKYQLVVLNTRFMFSVPLYSIFTLDIFVYSNNEYCTDEYTGHMDVTCVEKGFEAEDQNKSNIYKIFV